MHHALHVLLTGESGGYYGDYQPPLPHLGRCLTEGFAFQGERSAYRDGRARRAVRGPAAHRLRGLPPEPRSDRQSRPRRADGRARPRRRGARGHRGAPALARPAAALHGRGVGRARAVPVLQRSRPGPGPARVRGPPARVRPLPRVRRPRDARAHPRSPGRVHLQALGPRLESRGRARAQGLARPSTTTCSRCGPGRSRRCSRTSRCRSARGRRSATPRSRSRGRSRSGTLRLVANLGAMPVPHEGPGADWGRRLHALALPSPTWSTLPPWSVAFYLAGARPR